MPVCRPDPVIRHCSAENARYLKRIVEEHRAICEAIAARDAVRRHLTRSGERYGAFASRGPRV